MKFLQVIILLIFLSNQIFAQCFQNQTVYDFESSIQPWTKTNTYSFGQSNTSFEGGKSIFAKVSFDQNNQQARAGASTNFNNATQQWNNFQGIQFDFIFVVNDPTTVGKPAVRNARSRAMYLELTDQSGKIIKYYFTDENNSWHQRKALWSEFSGDAGFNKNAIVAMGFYTDRNNQNYTEIFRFDDIELLCDEDVEPEPSCTENQMLYNFEQSIQPWQNLNTYSYGQSNTSYQSNKSVFVKVAFDQDNQQARAGASVNFNVTQQWNDYKGIQFDFIFVNVAGDNSTAGKPEPRQATSRAIYLELTDQTGKKINHFFKDENNSWHQRTVLWSEFYGDTNFNKNAIAAMGFYTNRNNKSYTEVFRFDDIELYCIDEDIDIVEPGVVLLSDVAQNFTIPKGAPKYSDVCLTSRGRRTLNHPKYKIRTEDAIENFHPTRLDWTVVTDQNYVDEVIVPYGMKFSGVLNSKLPDNIGQYTVNANGRCLRSNGTKIEWPWLDTPSNYDQFVGSVNHPDYKQIYLDHARVFYSGAGINNLVAIQMDEPGFAIRLARNYGGCYGGYDQQKANELNYNINDYNQNIEFQKASLALFYEEMHNTFKAESGNQDLGFSYNNEGYDFSEDRSTQSFDFAMGELNTEITNPKDLFLASRTAKSFGKLQVFSPTRLVKNGPTNYSSNPGLYMYQSTNAQRDLNRKAIATAYASGSVHFVPWDTWFYDQTRHYGAADEYADLFGMIRAIPQYFDGYEDAALYSPNGSLNETRYDGNLPVKVNANNNNVWAFARAKPANANAPVVVHLVNWGSNSTNATVEILKNHISADGNFTAKLITPKAYNASSHELAKQQADDMLNGLRGTYQAAAYQNLIDVQDAPIVTNNQLTSSLNLSNLKTWSILILEPSATECVDSDGDGVCNAEDICANGDDNIDTDIDGTPDACDNCNLTGSTCNDNDVCTIGETYDNNCACSGGVFQDVDGDGVCDANDICSSGNDNVDTDNDNIPDACDDCPNDANNVCNVPSYCSSNGNSVEFEYIDNVTIGSINNTSGSNNGYGNFTNISTNLINGTTEYVSLTAGYVRDSYPENWKIWIDFNRDGDYSDAGEEVFSEIGSGTLTGSIIIPVNANLGATGMRVSMQYNSAPVSCGAFADGEVEDYIVNIISVDDKVVSPTIISKELFKVYPNPAKASIYIQLPKTVEAVEEEKTIAVKIYSTNGKLLIDKMNVMKDSLTMDIHNLPANQYYLINLTIEGVEQFSTKFLKL